MRGRPSRVFPGAMAAAAEGGEGSPGKARVGVGEDKEGAVLPVADLGTRPEVGRAGLKGWAAAWCRQPQPQKLLLLLPRPAAKEDGRAAGRRGTEPQGRETTRQRAAGPSLFRPPSFVGAAQPLGCPGTALSLGPRGARVVLVCVPRVCTPRLSIYALWSWCWPWVYLGGPWYWALRTGESLVRKASLCAVFGALSLRVALSLALLFALYWWIAVRRVHVGLLLRRSWRPEWKYGSPKVALAMRQAE